MDAFPVEWGLSYGWGCGLPAHVVRGQQNFVDEMNNAIGDFDVGLEDSGFFHHHCAWKHGGQIIMGVKSEKQSRVQFRVT